MRFALVDSSISVSFVFVLKYLLSSIHKFSTDARQAKEKALKAERAIKSDQEKWQTQGRKDINAAKEESDRALRRGVFRLPPTGLK